MHDFKKLRVICVGDPVTAEIARHAFEEAQEFESLAQHVPEKHREDVCGIAIALSNDSACSRSEALRSIIQAAELLKEPMSADEMQEIIDGFGPIINEQFLLMNNEPWGHLPILEEEPTEQWKSKVSKFKRECAAPGQLLNQKKPIAHSSSMTRRVSKSRIRKG